MAIRKMVLEHLDGRPICQVVVTTNPAERFVDGEDGRPVLVVTDAGPVSFQVPAAHAGLFGGIFGKFCLRDGAIRWRLTVSVRPMAPSNTVTGKIVAERPADEADAE